MVCHCETIECWFINFLNSKQVLHRKILFSSLSMLFRVVVYISGSFTSSFHLYLRSNSMWFFCALNSFCFGLHQFATRKKIFFYDTKYMRKWTSDRLTPIIDIPLTMWVKIRVVSLFTFLHSSEPRVIISELWGWLKCCQLWIFFTSRKPPCAQSP